MSLPWWLVEAGPTGECNVREVAMSVQWFWWSKCDKLVVNLKVSTSDTWKQTTLASWACHAVNIYESFFPFERPRDKSAMLLRLKICENYPDALAVCVWYLLRSNSRFKNVEVMKYHSFLNIFIVTQPDFACIPLLCTGRVLAVTGQSNDFKEALRRAYEAVSKISFDPPGSSSCLAVQKAEALFSPISLSPLAGSHLCISCLFWDSPCYSIQFSCLVPLSVYQIFTSKCHGNSTAHLHFRFQHAFPSGYWPQGRLDGWRCRAAPFFGWSMDAILSMSMGLRCFNTTWFRYIQIRMQGLRSRVFCQGLCLIDNLLCWYTEDKIWRNLDLPLDFPGCGLISCFDAKINTFLNII